MPPKVTTEAEDDEPVVTGTTSTSTTSASGPGTLRQRFKLTVDDISKEVEELSVKLKRKVCHSTWVGVHGLCDRVMVITRSVDSENATIQLMFSYLVGYDMLVNEEVANHKHPEHLSTK